MDDNNTEQKAEPTVVVRMRASTQRRLRILAGRNATTVLEMIDCVVRERMEREAASIIEELREFLPSKK